MHCEKWYMSTMFLFKLAYKIHKKSMFSLCNWARCLLLYTNKHHLLHGYLPNKDLCVFAWRCSSIKVAQLYASTCASRCLMFTTASFCYKFLITLFMFVRSFFSAFCSRFCSLSMTTLINHHLRYDILIQGVCAEGFHHIFVIIFPFVLNNKINLN